MHWRFLTGLDVGFVDYASIDADEQLDDLQKQELMDQERYFEGEDEEDV